jgi:hypothetical protein
LVLLKKLPVFIILVVQALDAVWPFRGVSKEKDFRHPPRWMAVKRLKTDYQICFSISRQNTPQCGRKSVKIPGEIFINK